MTPYRQPQPTWTPPLRKKKKRTPLFGFGHVALGLLLASFASIKLIALYPTWWPAPVCATVAAILILIFGQPTPAIARLARIVWHHGDKLGGVLLFSGVATPSYSPNRIARNRRALKAAQVGMPKARMGVFWRNDERDDRSVT